MEGVARAGQRGWAHGNTSGSPSTEGPWFPQMFGPPRAPLGSQTHHPGPTPGAACAQWPVGTGQGAGSACQPTVQGCQGPEHSVLGRKRRGRRGRGVCNVGEGCMACVRMCVCVYVHDACVVCTQGADANNHYDTDRQPSPESPQGCARTASYLTQTAPAATPGCAVHAGHARRPR